MRNALQEIELLGKFTKFMKRYLITLFDMIIISKLYDIQNAKMLFASKQNRKLQLTC